MEPAREDAAAPVAENTHVEPPAYFKDFETRMGNMLAGFERSIDAKLDTFQRGFDAKLDTFRRDVDARFGELQNDVQTMDTRLIRLEVRQRNGLLGRNDTISWPPNGQGLQPPNQEWATMDLTISHLIVAGNESLPNGSVNDWSSNRSKAALDFYGDNPSDSEAEDNEHSERSRNRRLRLAKHLGISRSQLNFAHLTL